MAGRAARVVAQAKINLFLRVLAREESGYHQIETLFCRLDFCDDVVVRVADRGWTLDTRGADVGPVERNLAYRAAALYAQAAEWPRGFAIELEKRIPVGGGLGGGSADAGAVLRALNALNAEPLPLSELLALASRLGADVPVLTTEAVLALAWGRGERMLALPALPPKPVVLLVPPFSVETKAAYEWLAEDVRARLPLTSWPLAAPSACYTVPQLGTWESVGQVAGSVFESVIDRRHGEVGHIRAVLEALPRPNPRLVMMTGSGSTVFGVFDEAPDLSPLARLEGCRAILTATAGHVAQVEVID
jgi:4-diphosphocytidyl-2-C-methyl-D-erythritol kinase